MRSLHRWISRLFGFVVVLGLIHLMTPPRAATPTAAAPIAPHPHLAALRIAPVATLSPDLTLWGAGPAMDLQWSVSVVGDAAEDELPEIPAAAPPRRKPQNGVRPRSKGPTGEARDWRYDRVYDRVDR